MKTYLKIGFALFLTCTFIVSSAQDKKFDIGLRSGVFVPSHWMIQGYQSVSYIDGSPVDISIMGFGNGSIMNLYVKFFFKNNIGIMLDGGAVLLQKNKEDIALAPNGDQDMYENKLLMFPINLSIIYKIKIPESKFTPFIGAGLGGYISEWEQKHYPEFGDRTWLQDKQNYIGFHFLSGFDFPIYHDLIFNFEFGYNYASAEWRITNPDTNNETVYKNLNMGGISLKVGLGFKF